MSNCEHSYMSGFWKLEVFFQNALKELGFCLFSSLAYGLFRWGRGICIDLVLLNSRFEFKNPVITMMAVYKPTHQSIIQFNPLVKVFLEVNVTRVKEVNLKGLNKGPKSS